MGIQNKIPVQAQYRRSARSSLDHKRMIQNTPHSNQPHWRVEMEDPELDSACECYSTAVLLII